MGYSRPGLVLFLIVVGFGFGSTQPKNGELFTAQAELEGLFETQQSVIELFESYIAKEEVRLKEIRRRLIPYVETGRRSPPEVIGNPISAFLLLKGLTVDLDDLLNISEHKNGDGESFIGVGRHLTPRIFLVKR
jgi:hypothetical protein